MTESWKSKLRWGTKQIQPKMDIELRQTGGGVGPVPGNSQGGTTPVTGGGNSPGKDEDGGNVATGTSVAPISTPTSGGLLPDDLPEGGTPTVMVFEKLDPIYWISRADAVKLSWKPANDSIEATKLSWSARSKSKKIEYDIASTTIFGWNEDSTFFTKVEGISASLLIDKDRLLDYMAEIMWIRLDWRVGEDGQEGVTTSPFFGVVSTQEGFDQLNMTISAANSLVGSDSGTETLSTSTSTPEPSNNKGSSSKGHKLAPGAIAGIAIGIAIFGAILAALAWFLLRRRRKTKGVRVGYTGTRSTPLSDSRGVADTDADADADGAAPTTSIANSFMVSKNTNNYSSRITEAPDTPTTSSASGRQNSSRATQDVSIGFLVEEGMTEDDIRRLEEEERQLDADLERMHAMDR